ncbi:MAG: hypothetical protein ABIX01_00445 [Chitinophagaceae bacterium]
MILLEVGNLMPLVVVIYLVCHIPAFIMLGMGLAKRKTKPEAAKKLLIAAGIYFLIGGGICGAILRG